MSTPEFDIVGILLYWKQYTDGNIPLKQNEQYQNIEEIALEALQDLDNMIGAFQPQLFESKISLIYFCEICELTDTIERIVKCIFNDKPRHQRNPLDINRMESSLSKLREIGNVVNRSIQCINIMELQAPYAIEQLRLIDPNFPARVALNFGLLSKEIFIRAVGISSTEVMERCLRNAKLVSARDLINLFIENEKKPKNIITIIKDHLDQTREEAIAKMDPKTREAFVKQWSAPVTRDWIYEGKIKPHNSLGTPEKIEAWDFLKQASFTEELNSLSSDEKILFGARLYKGEKGDFFLAITNYEVDDSGKAILGEDNFKKLKKFDNYLWSPDGHSFFFMKSTGYGGTGQAYHVSFETKEGSQNAGVGMNVNEVYATLEDKDRDLGATYLRQNLESVRQIFAAIKSGEIQVIPLKTARKPEYLFQMASGQYIYVDSSYANYDYDFEVYIGSNGNYQKLPLNKVTRFRDGGTTIVDLANGGRIFSPTHFDSHLSPTYTESTGQEHDLKRLNERDFDYSSIGIGLQLMNPRHTMLDLYHQ